MKVIILAAGQGNRLAPLTDDRPKCMVEYRKKPIIDHILEAMAPVGFEEKVAIGGYRADVLRKHLAGKDVRVRENRDYASTNMVATLFSAEDEMDRDVVISYSDIIYSVEIAKAIAASDAPVSVVVDRKWRKLWELRMEDPLKDAETMKLDAKGNILELGKKPKSCDEIQGQYIGLIKYSAKALPQNKAFYHSLDKAAIYDGKSYPNMYMTSFLQLIIDRLFPAKAVFIDGGWIEVDRPADLNVPLDWATAR